MKKILSLLTSAILITSTSFTVVACSNDSIDISKIDFNSGTSNDGTTFKEKLSSQFLQGSDFSFDTMQNENTTGYLSQWLAGFLVKKYNIKTTNIKKFIAAHLIQTVNFKLNGLPSNPLSLTKVQLRDEISFVIDEEISNDYFTGSQKVTYIVS